MLFFFLSAKILWATGTHLETEERRMKSEMSYNIPKSVVTRTSPTATNYSARNKIRQFATIVKKCRGFFDEAPFPTVPRGL